TRPASGRAVRRIARLDGRNAIPSRPANEFAPDSVVPTLESRGILPSTISVRQPDFVRRPVGPASAESDPRLANNVPPSTPRLPDRIFGTTTLAPLLWSTGRRANSVDRDIRPQWSAPSWLLDAVPIAKREAFLDVVLSGPAVRRVPPAPSSGSPYLERPRKPEPPRFAKDLSERLPRLVGEGLLAPPPAASEHLAFPWPTR